MPSPSHAFHYDSDLIGGSLMVRESRIVAELLLAGADQDEWRRAIHDENRLQKTRPATARRTAQAIRKRLERLAPLFWEALRDGDDQLAAQLAFCAALARNLLLLEFVETVVADAFITQAETLASYQWEDFLAERSTRDPAIADWAPSSRKKMGQVALRMLSEVGVLSDSRHRRLQPLFLRHEVAGLLEAHHQDRIHRCLLALGPH